MDAMFQGLGLILADHGDDDLGADRPAHHLDRLVQRQAEYRFAIDMGDEIAGLDPGGICRGVVDRRHHLDEALFLGHLDAQTAELAPGLHPHVGGVIRRQIAGMRVERGQHAVDRGLDQLAFVDLLDILRANAFEDVAKQVKLLVDIAR